MKNIGILLVLFFLISTFDAASSTRNTSTNMIVDFDNTATDASLHAGDSSILNLVISNTGGFNADNVEILLPSTAAITLDKRFYVGTVTSGESKTLPVLLRVSNQAKTGLSAIQVTISFDGFNSVGDTKNNQLTRWEIPVTIFGEPLFQITPQDTSFFKDTLAELTLKGLTKDSVKDLMATFTSTCATIMGSSRKYVGDLSANQHFNITYEIKPTSSGACQSILLLSYKDESGSRATDNITLGLNVKDEGVDFKVMNISYEPTGPGETVIVNIVLKNVGQATADDVTLSLSLSTPFVPVDTTEKYIGNVVGGKTIETAFNVNVGMDASIQPYSVPLNISYKVGGSSYSVNKDIGLDVAGKIILEIINIDTSRGLQIEVANIGTRTAEGVKAILNLEDSGNHTMRQATPSQHPGSSDTQQMPTGNPLTMLRGGRMGGGQRATQGMPSGGAQTMAGASGSQLVEYKSNIKPTSQTTFTFDTTLTGPATLTLEYTGLNNERVTQTEIVSIGSSRMAGLTSFSRNGNRGTSNSKYITYGLLALIILWVVYAKRTNRKVVPDSVRQKLSELRGRFKRPG